MNTIVTENVGIFNNMGANQASISGLYSVQLSEYRSGLLLECFILVLRPIRPCDGELTPVTRESFLD